MKCKLFADDTTIYKIGDDLAKMMSDFGKLLTSFFDWCNFNRLDINWSKTYGMVITNKRIKIPKFLTIAGTQVEIVDKFRLLGVTIDSKLNFETHVSELKRQINRRIYSIKKLFYLSFTVKMHFFKTFILPSFDYCLSLLIYYSKNAIQKLANSYYLCLFKLYKLSFCSDDYNQVNEKLKKIGIFDFHYRIVNRLSIFVYKIFIFKNPPNLASELKFNRERNIKYDLRNSEKLIQPCSSRVNGEKTFGYFFSRFVNLLFVDCINNKLTFKDFRHYLLKNLNNFVNLSLKTFDKLNFYIKFSYFY